MHSQLNCNRNTLGACSARAQPTLSSLVHTLQQPYCVLWLLSMLGINCYCSILVTFAQLAALVSCTYFTITDTYTGDAFFNKFNFLTFDDPTHGRVVSELLLLCFVQCSASGSMVADASDLG
jgi:hypothetical protein